MKVFELLLTALVIVCVSGHRRFDCEREGSGEYDGDGNGQVDLLSSNICKIGNMIHENEGESKRQQGKMKKRLDVIERSIEAQGVTITDSIASLEQKLEEKIEAMTVNILRNTQEKMDEQVTRISASLAAEIKKQLEGGMNAMEEKIKNLIGPLERKINDIDEKLTNCTPHESENETTTPPTADPTTATTTTPSPCPEGQGALYEDRCFWIEMGFFMIYSGLEARCQSKGGSAANVYDSGHYQKVLEFLRSDLEEQPFVASFNYWLGMKYDSETGNVYLRDGSGEGYAKWKEGYPTMQGQRPQIIISVATDPLSAGNGMYNAWGGTPLGGMLCEKTKEPDLSEYFDIFENYNYFD